MATDINFPVSQVCREVVDDLDNYIDYWSSIPGKSPTRLLISRRQYNTLRKEAARNEALRALMGGGMYRGLPLEVHSG